MKKRIIFLTTLVGLVIKIIKTIQSKRCKVFGLDCGGKNSKETDLEVSKDFEKKSNSLL